MTLRGMLLVLATALCTVIANLSLRAGIVRIGSFSLSLKAMIPQFLSLIRQPLFVTGFVFYGVAALIWFRVISTENLSTSYPILVSLTFLLVTLGAMFFFHEQVSWQKVIGLAVILGGIIIVARG